MTRRVDSDSSRVYDEVPEETQYPVYDEVPEETQYPVYDEVPTNAVSDVLGNTLGHGSIGAVHHPRPAEPLPHSQSTTHFSNTETPTVSNTQTTRLENNRFFLTFLQAQIDEASNSGLFRKLTRKPLRVVTPRRAGAWLNYEKYTHLVEARKKADAWLNCKKRTGLVNVKQRALEEKNLYYEAFTKSINCLGIGLAIRYKAKNLLAAAEFVHKIYIRSSNLFSVRAFPAVARKAK